MTKEDVKYPVPWYKKINPFWWFGNYNDPVDRMNLDGTPAHPDFFPNKPLWFRKIAWGCRNPLHNLQFFVLGFEDRPNIVNPGTIWPKEGQKWNIVLPFISYRGKKREFYIGWRNGKTLGAAFRKAKTKAM